MSKIKRFLSFLYGLSLLGPSIALAWSWQWGGGGGEQPPNAPRAPFTTGAGMLNVLNNIVNWIMVMVIIVAALYIALAAYNYMTAAGDEEKIKTANRRLTYAIIAVVIVFVAKGLILAVRSIVGA